MITIKESISFPASSYVDGRENHLYMDIETTGLDRKRSIIYIIGCSYREQDSLRLIQWFNDDGKSEREILLAFMELMDRKGGILTSFNGEVFDFPYLEDHCRMHDLAFDPSRFNSLDYYKLLRPYRSLFSLKKGRQKDWESFLGISREDRLSGGDLINVYRDYLRTHSEEALRLLLLHNKEDLLGLSLLDPLLAYPDLWEGRFSIERMEAGSMGDKLMVFCSLPHQVPVPLLFENMEPLSSFEVKNHHCIFAIPLLMGELKHYYDNPADYYYLPAEDRAIHKSVGRYVEKEYRRQASASDCYIRREGLFVPAAEKKSRYGFQAGSRLPYQSFTLFKKTHSDTRSYLDFDDIFARDHELITAYLTDLLHEASIRRRQDPSLL